MSSNDSSDKPLVKVIYARVSGLQTHATCNAQVKLCQRYLMAQDIDPTDFIVICDEGSSRSDRPGFAKVLEFLHAKRLGMLIVDSIDRLGRNDGNISFLRDVMASGGNFIVVADGISTADKNWAMQVRIASMSDEEFTALTAERARQGQARQQHGDQAEETDAA